MRKLSTAPTTFRAWRFFFHHIHRKQKKKQSTVMVAQRLGLHRARREGASTSLMHSSECPFFVFQWVGAENNGV